MEELLNELPVNYTFESFGGHADSNGMVYIPIDDEDPDAYVIVNNSYDKQPTYSITITKMVEVLNGTPAQGDTFDVQVTDGDLVVTDGGPNAIQDGQSFVVSGLLAGTYYVEELLDTLPAFYSSIAIVVMLT